MTITHHHHYHVVENTPGYLPESEPSCHSSLREAREAALEMKHQLREEGYHVSGSLRAGYFYAVLNHEDLGRVIEIIEMEGEPCQT